MLLNLVNICTSRARNIWRMIRRTQHIYSPINVETSSPSTKSNSATTTTVSLFLLLSVAPDKFLASTADGSRPLPVTCLHYSPSSTDRHCTLSSPFTKSQRNLKKIIKSHVVRSEIPRHVTTYILNYTASCHRTQVILTSTQLLRAGLCKASECNKFTTLII